MEDPSPAKDVTCDHYDDDDDGFVVLVGQYVRHTSPYRYVSLQELPLAAIYYHT